MRELPATRFLNSNPPNDCTPLTVRDKLRATTSLVQYNELCHPWDGCSEDKSAWEPPQNIKVSYFSSVSWHSSSLIRRHTIGQAPLATQKHILESTKNSNGPAPEDKRPLSERYLTKIQQMSRSRKMNSRRSSGPRELSQGASQVHLPRASRLPQGRALVKADSGLPSSSHRQGK